MLNSEIRKDRSSVGFIDAVTSEFAFLLQEFAFSCVNQNVTYVRYASDKVFVNVYHGRASYELNVEIGLRSFSPSAAEASFTIEDILYALAPEKAESYRPYEAVTRDSVRKFVKELALLIKSHAGPALRGDEETFAKIAAVQLRRSQDLVQSWELKRARREADIAWQEKNFKQVVEIFEPLKDHLSPAEMKKLEYARKKVASAN